MTRDALPSWLRSDSGSASVEFVVVFLTFILIIFFVIEVTLYMFFLASVEKAVQAGVRVAAVSRPVVNVPLANEPDGVSFGQTCGALGETCNGFTSQCSSDCNGDSFDRILDHMRGFNGRIHQENVAVHYQYAGIGFAGGPTAPIVTVTVSCVPFQTGILGLLVGNLDNQFNPGGECAQLSLPPRSASMTGEDLAP
jgi:hypothetical protein